MCIRDRVLDLRVKWPNDLVTPDGQKVAGILARLDLHTEFFSGGPRIRHLVLGVGVNVNQTDFPAHLPAASSLARVRGARVDRAALLGRLVQAIEAVDPNAPAPLDRWRARSHTLGRRVRIGAIEGLAESIRCLLYTSPSPRDATLSRMPSSA